MVLLIALFALTAWATISTLVEVRRDGYRQTPTDWSRVSDRVSDRNATQRAESMHGYR
ncbi:hypothetical protein AB0O87_02055 [Microbacterium sp. NPDC076768]|uniref:hypothetical protein n=1 Tax=Microbacterium sp. NPDC076768 TaxID=3154858 RepID=UPI00343C92FA